MALLRDLLQSYSTRKILTTLAGLSGKTEDVEVSQFLHHMFNILNMTYKEIEALTVRKTGTLHGKHGLWNKSGNNI